MGKAGKGKMVVHAFGTEAIFSELSYTYPLKLLSPKLSSSGTYPTAVAYVLSYGGGLVPGDRIEVEVEVDKGCALVILTQGSTKIFKARTDHVHRLANISTLSIKDSLHVDHNSLTPKASDSTSILPTIQCMTIKVSADGLLLLLVDPITCFRGASYTQYQTFHLTPTSSLILLDWFTAGRISRGEEWDFFRYHNTNEIWVGSKRRARDVILLEQQPNSALAKSSASLKQRLAPYRCYATVIMLGPLVMEVAHTLERRQSEVQQMQRGAPHDFLWSICELPADSDCSPGWVLRAAAEETETIKVWLKEALCDVQDTIGREIYSKAFL